MAGLFSPEYVKWCMECKLLDSVSYVIGFVPFVKIIAGEEWYILCSKRCYHCSESQWVQFCQTSGASRCITALKGQLSSCRFLWIFRIMLPHLKIYPSVVKVLSLTYVSSAHRSKGINTVYVQKVHLYTWLLTHCNTFTSANKVSPKLRDKYLHLPFSYVVTAVSKVFITIGNLSVW